MGKINLTKKERGILLAVFFVLSLFFTHVMLSIAEKNKGYLLLISSLGIFFLFLFQLEKKKIWRLFCRDQAIVVIAAVFLANALFFSEGMWNLAVNTGTKMWENWQGLALFFFLPTPYFIFIGFQFIPAFYRRWFLLSVIFLGLIILKPTPRYYEWVSLTGAIFLALGFYRRKKLALFFMPFLLLHSAAIYWSYFSKHISDHPREVSLRLFVWKDSSRDFLSKQRLADFLSGSGCDYSDIHSVDFRVKESLRAISYGSWPKRDQSSDRHCLWGKGVNISMRSEYAEQPGDDETAVADFFVWEKKN